MMKNPELDTDFRSSGVAMMTAQLAEMLAAVIATVLQLGSNVTHLTYVLVLQTPLVFLVCGLLFKEKSQKVSVYVSCVLLALELPVLYCSTGGVEGPGLLWFMFSFLLFSVMLPYRHAMIVIALDVVCFTATAIITKMNPDLVYPMKQETIRLNMWLSATDIAIATALIVFFQKIITDANEAYLKKLQKDVSEKNAELVASQEELMTSNEEMIAINEDLSNMTKQLNATLEAERVANEQQKRFTAMLNHELRNPLNGIMGYLQMRISDPEIPDDIKRGVKDTYSLAENMLQTVNDILDFSKMEEGKFEIVKTNFFLNDLIHNLHVIFDGQARGKGLNLDFNVPKRSYEITTDGVRLQQVFSNLLSNSVKYTNEGSVTVTISLNAKENENGTLQVRIKDTGKGMTEEELLYIYEPYKRFDMENNKKIQGTGLGMCIVKNLVEGLEGKIEVKSEVGKGTEFIVEVPTVVCSIDKEREDVITDASKIDFSGKTILCADDDGVNIRVLNAFLRKGNAKVVLAKNGKDALDLIQSGKYEIDLLITDNRMPEMSGTELKAEMNRLGIQLPAIVLTGATDHDSVETFKEVGFDAILEKPITQIVLFTTMAKILK